MLLYGTNACGKSTLMKSIGLTLIMAQAGFYVPCSSLKYSPYTQIFTRILNNDNIFKRQSSFAVEMSELRSILKRSDNQSLVLGDEVCSGTETTSALSIVSAALKTLSDIKCSFIFTSHLHQLMDIKLVQDIKTLDVYHLQIEYNPETEVLIYKRILEKGSGPAIYGLEVCKSLNLSSDFISLARKVQLQLTNTSETLLNDKHSNYNNDVVMDLCQICKKESEHTHHIKEQCTADLNGIIDHHHKNITHNLVQLCESCHHKVHNENLRIYGYHQTNDGIKLNYEYIDISKVHNSKKKFNQKDLQTILNYKSDISGKKMKKSSLIKKLELEHHIQISGSTLNKVLKGEY
jgi:DNA mismatch repair protein MutS